MTKMTDEQLSLRNHILRECVARMDALQLKGKRRDDEVITYLCGATTALKAVGNAVANNLEILLTMILSVRPSYNECKSMIAVTEKLQEAA